MCGVHVKVLISGGFPQSIEKNCLAGVSKGIDRITTKIIANQQEISNK